VVETQSDVLRKSIAGIDRPDLNMKISAGTLTFNVVTGYVLVLEIGAVGAVLATLLAELGRYTVNVVILYREQPSIELVPTLLKYEFAAGVAMFVVVYALGGLIRITSWLPLLLIVGVGASVYFCVLTAISRQFQRTARSVATSMGLDELLDV
jgi:O-antigen/teichoic acid export membrane protein